MLFTLLNSLSFYHSKFDIHLYDDIRYHPPNVYKISHVYIMIRITKFFFKREIMLTSQLVLYILNQDTHKPTIRLITGFL